MPTLDPPLREFLTDWLGAQRWYTGKGRAPQLTRIGGLRWQDPDGSVGIDTHLLRDDSGPAPVIYHVPLTYRAEPLDSLHTALIARTEHSELGTRYIYDAPADPVYVQALLGTLHEGGTVTSDTGAAGGSATGHVAIADWPTPVLRRSAVLTGEQSNTSIIVELDGADPVIVKIFRVIQAGDNPDVAVQTALAEAGSTYVPAPIGHLRGTWPGPDGQLVGGDLAFAQEFLPGVEDAWRVAIRAVAAGEDFAIPARAIGVATAAVHHTLRTAFDTSPVQEEDRQMLLGRLDRRLNEAIEAVPSLAAYRDPARALYARAGSVAWPGLQRIHGDLHLGQVLQVPAADQPDADDRWVLVDFEGEPLRPLAERTAPDLALRDVAGMLRSFDYAAATSGESAGGATWAHRARKAFLTGYTSGSGFGDALIDTGAVTDSATDDAADGAAVVLRALELDKALYEVVYEVRNRPSWVAIPTAAVERLVNQHAGVDIDPEPDESGSEPESTSEPSPAAAALEVTSEIRSTTSSEVDATPDADTRRPARAPLDGVEAERLVRGLHGNPHGILGAHPYDGGVTIRALRPLATEVAVVLPDGGRAPMEHETHGIFTAVLPTDQVPDYRIEARWGDESPEVHDEPWRYLPTLGEIDLHLINEGRHEHLWQVLGAHLRSYDGPLGEVHGASFALWAPNATSVHLVGDLNGWSSSTHPMRALGASGVWEIFVPGAQEGSKYKFLVTGRDGKARLKADPMARAAEVPPNSASILTHSHYQWNDQDWLEQRGQRDPHIGPMSIYEVHLLSWRQGQSYRELAEHLVNYVRAHGFTHVEFMPVMQHPYAPSWGYHVTGYYAADSRLGSPDDLRFLIDRLHQAGIGVILDWVPGHFATDPWALARFDGTALYEHPDPRRGWHPEWGSYIFDFGRPEVRNFLVANALYWIEEFHADGLRVDGVASMLYLDYSRPDGQWLPNTYGGRENLEAVALLQETNATVYRRNPGAVVIAEESTSWPGVTRPTDEDGLGFGFKWNMGWMHDSLSYVSRQPVYRQYHHHQLTFSLMYAFNERFVLPISHDEVVHGKGSLLGKMAGDAWQRLANLRAYLAFMWAHPGKQLLFMGSEFAQESEWADGRSLDWWLLGRPQHAGVLHLVRDLNALYREHPALWEGDHHSAGFQWLNADDAQGNTFSFIRYGNEREPRGSDSAPSRPALVAVANFSGAPRPDVRLGLPHGGRWREVLNTDAQTYGGSGVGNLGSVHAENIPEHGQRWSATVTLPPLGVLWLAPEVDEDSGDEPSGDQRPDDQGPDHQHGDRRLDTQQVVSQQVVEDQNAADEADEQKE